MFFSCFCCCCCSCCCCCCSFVADIVDAAVVVPAVVVAAVAVAAIIVAAVVVPAVVTNSENRSRPDAEKQFFVLFLPFDHCKVWLSMLSTLELLVLKAWILTLILHIRP